MVSWIQLKVFLTVFITILAGFGGCLGRPPAVAAASEQKQAAGPLEMVAYIYVVNISKFEITSGTYTADFYLSFESQEPIPDKFFEFMNGRATSIELTYDEKEDDIYTKSYRIVANLSSNIDLRKYPFDSQELFIKIESKDQGIDELVFVPRREDSKIDPGNYFIGWSIRDYDIFSTEHKYIDSFQAVYSQLVFRIDIERLFISSFIKTFLPVMIVMLIVMASLFLDFDKMGAIRFSTLSSSLLATALFHISIHNQLPAVSYTNFADKFIFLTYFVLLVCFALNIALGFFNVRNQKELVKRINTCAIAVLYPLAPVSYIILFWLFI